MILQIQGIPGFGTGKAEYTIAAIPILAQGRYYLGVPGGPRPFLGALVGFHLMQFKYSASYTFLGVTQSQDFTDNSTKFGFAPMGGIEIGALEVVAFYMLVSDFNYVGARLGFNFGGIE